MIDKEDNPVSTKYNMSLNDEVYLKKIALKYIHNWYWFVLSLLIFGFLAFIYNRSLPTVYSLGTSILIESNKQESPMSGSGFSDENVFQGFGAMGVDRNINNQMVILKSRPLIDKTLNELNFEVSYFSVGRIKKVERFNESPFTVIWDANHSQVIDVEFSLEFLPDGKIRIQADAENVRVYDYLSEKVVDQISNFSISQDIENGDILKSTYYSFRIEVINDINTNLYDNYIFKFESRKSLVEKYYKRLSVGFLQKETSILEVTLEELDFNKGIIFLNTLTQVYQSYIVEKKNENANRVITFISNQLQSVSDSLMESGDEKQSFQKEHQILDISLQSQQLLQQINQLDEEMVAMENKDKYYKYLREYILNNQELETIIAPSAMGIEDQLLNALILELNNLSIEKSSMTSVKNTEHPKLKRLNAQIDIAKKNLLENVNNIISQSERALMDMSQRIWRLDNQVRTLPQTERDYINIERKYRLNNETYTFLLQKMSDAQIAKASNLSDSFIIEEARIKEVPSQLKKMRLYIAALLLSFLVPIIIIFIRGFFNSKVLSENDIMEITNIPILGRVFQKGRNGKEVTIVLNHPNSSSAESFRAIKSKIDYNLRTEDTPIIAITSSSTKEGKTYNAINIASIYALNKRKTVLLDLDFRRSSISQIFRIDAKEGLFDNLTGKAKIEKIISKTDNPYLDIITVGAVPENPAELLAAKQFANLIMTLKEKYEYIIVDTAPVGMVADILQFSTLFDATLIIVRKKVTNKNGLKWVLNEVSQYGFKNLGLILNNIHPRERKLGYGYGYGLNKLDRKFKKLPT